MAYATTDDLQRRWRVLSPDETMVAEQLLEDAATILGTYENDHTSDAILSIVSCNMVRRAMSASGDAFQLDGQVADSPYWESSLPAGNLWLSASDRRLLNRGARIGFASMSDLNEPQ